VDSEVFAAVAEEEATPLEQVATAAQVSLARVEHQPAAAQVAEQGC
jgi:hypothetical protein